MIIFISGCSINGGGFSDERISSNRGQTQKIKLHMSVEDVKQIMGKPYFVSSSSKPNDGKTNLYYRIDRNSKGNNLFMLFIFSREHDQLQRWIPVMDNTLTYNN